MMIAWTIYVTFAGAVVLLFLPRGLSRWIALVTTVAGFVVSLIAFFQTAYYVEVELTRTDASGNPGIKALGLGHDTP